MPASDSYIETEVKIRFPEGAAAARALIERVGYELFEERTLESDQLFDRANEELRASDRVLRLRRTGERAIVTYKGPKSNQAQLQRYKSREEIEFDISNAPAFERMLDRLGFVPRFRYEKYRTKFRAPGESGVLAGVVSIDETPIGVFLELEGAPDWIDQTASRLGLSTEEYLTASYANLYQQYLRAYPATSQDMTFSEGHS
jgi:adenylate cyclase, class 2